MRFSLFIVLAIVGLVADLWTKQSVFATRGLPGQMEPYWLVEPFVGIETAVNMGALFGLGQGFGWLFSALSVVAAVGIVYWLFVMKASRSLWVTVSMGLVTGGIFGNLYDRLGVPDLPPQWKGGVRDWILLKYGDYVWPNFNIADSLLVVGAIMLALYSLKSESNRTESKQQPKEEPLVQG